MTAAALVAGDGRGSSAGARERAEFDLADCFLVATGISASFSELDPEKLQALVATVRAWRP